MPNEKNLNTNTSGHTGSYPLEAAQPWTEG